jgi:hypothetical protein
MLLSGDVKYQQTMDGHKQYKLVTDEKVYDYAYKAEIIQYINTKEFKYNEDLKNHGHNHSK